MVMILDRVEAAMADFRPSSQAEFVALQLARRFDDLHRLPRYVRMAREHSKDQLLHAARVAMLRHHLNRAPTSDLFFEALLEAHEKGER